MTRNAIVKEPSGRPTRTPVGRRNVLTVRGKEPGYEYRIVNDDVDRIDLLKDAGWEVVLNSEVNVGDKRVNQTTAVGTAATMSVGNGMKGVVMRIKSEWYEEDHKAKMRLVDEQESTTRTAHGADYGSISSKRETS